MPDKFTFPATPPKNAIRFLKNKGVQPGFDWRDVWGLEHAHAFTVAKAMQLDLLQEIRESLVENLREGQTYAQWAGKIEPELKKRGWWGYDFQKDPKTGEIKQVKLGTPRRLETIYNANIRSARAAGAWQRIERTKKTHPFLRYELGPSENHRDAHLSLAGTLRPANDVFWDSHYPPNGWGCKCWVRQINSREAERLGGVSPKPKIKYKNWKNKRTGETMRVPQGIDPGWQFNPGKARTQNLRSFLNGKLDAAPPAIRAAAIQDMAGSNLLKLMFDGKIVHREVTVPVGVVSAKAQTRLGAKTRVVVISGETMALKKSKHPEITFPLFERIQKEIDNAVVTDQLSVEKLKSQRLDMRIDGKPYRLVIRATRVGELFVQSVYGIKERQFGRK